MSDEECAWWLREVMAGRDPDQPRDTHGNPRNPVPDNLQCPDWGTRMRAARMFFERRNGQPAQYVHIQQELKAEIATARVSLTPQTIAAMAPEKKTTLRALLREAVTGIARTPVDTIPVHAAEVPPEVSSTITDERIEFPLSSNLIDAHLYGDMLTVRFRRTALPPGPRRVYTYANVTHQMMLAWRRAPSAGAWFATEIRKNPHLYPLVQPVHTDVHTDVQQTESEV